LIIDPEVSERVARLVRETLRIADSNFAQ